MRKPVGEMTIHKSVTMPRNFWEAACAHATQVGRCWVSAAGILADLLKRFEHTAFRYWITYGPEGSQHLFESWPS